MKGDLNHWLYADGSICSIIAQIVDFRCYKKLLDEFS